MPNTTTLKNYIEDHKQAFYLFSLTVLFVGDVFFADASKAWAIRVLFVQNMLFGLVLIREHQAKWLFRWVVLLLVLSLARFASIIITSADEIPWLGQSVFILYFLTIGAVLFQSLYKAKAFGMESIYAVFSGFIILIVMFAYVLMLVDGFHPGSFNGIASGGAYSDYLYFSLITMLTIGYGDITPATEVARRVIGLGALVGHFYTVFITALIIGKLFK